MKQLQEQEWVGGSFEFVDDTGTGSVGSITITGAGAGHGSTAPKVTLSPPDGSSGTTATAKAILTNGSISAFGIEDAGSGYTSPTVTIQPVDRVNPSKPATAAATLTGSVASIETTTAGGGDDSAPEVTISKPEHDGTQATAKATVEDRKITRIEITNAGSGYTRDSPPGVDIPAPRTTSGTPATAAATLHPTREECKNALKLLFNLCKTMQTSCDKSIFLWMPNEANTTLKNSGSKESCHQPCAVVRFEGPRAEGCAAKFVKEFEEKKMSYVI
jgi:hypothetical protein